MAHNVLGVPVTSYYLHFGKVIGTPCYVKTRVPKAKRGQNVGS